MKGICLKKAVFQAAFKRIHSLTIALIFFVGWEGPVGGPPVGHEPLESSKYVCPFTAPICVFTLVLGILTQTTLSTGLNPFTR